MSGAAGESAPYRVLLIDDDPDDALLTRDLFRQIQNGTRYQLDWIDGFDAGLAAMAGDGYDLCLIDHRLGARSGLHLLERLVAGGCRAPIIVFTGQGDRALDLEAMRAGAVDFLDKRTVDAAGLERAVRYALERHGAQERLRLQKETLEQILDHLPVMVCRFDAQGRFSWVSRSWERTLGWTLEEAQAGDLLGEAYPDPETRAGVLAFMAASTGEWAEFDTRVRSGETLRTVWSNVRLPDGTSIGIGQDITERSTLEAQLRQAQKMEAVGQLAGGIAHDFNNLLTAITGHAELLLMEQELRSEMRTEVEEIRRAAERAAALTRQLLAFSRRQVLQPQEVDVNALVRNVERMLARLIGEDIRLTTVLDQNAGTVLADPGQVEQVVLNLAINARDAMPDGGTLVISTDQVRVDVQAGPEDPQPGVYTSISVTDTGTGIAPEVRDRIFEPFFTTKEQGRGTGLGLSTVYGIVKQSRGHIRFESERGQGSRFTVLLPEVGAPAQEPKEHAEPPKPIRRGAETVLVVEDDGAVRSLLRRTLERQGYRVLEARNGYDALDVVSTFARDIDLLVTDIVMPGLNGLEMAQELRRRGAGLRVLYTSGYTADRLPDAGIAELGTSFIEKPFSPDAFLRKVRDILDAA